MCLCGGPLCLIMQSAPNQQRMSLIPSHCARCRWTMCWATAAAPGWWALERSTRRCAWGWCGCGQWGRRRDGVVVCRGSCAKELHATPSRWMLLGRTHPTAGACGIRVASMWPVCCAFLLAVPAPGVVLQLHPGLEGRQGSHGCAHPRHVSAAAALGVAGKPWFVNHWYNQERL